MTEYSKRVEQQIANMQKTLVKIYRIATGEDQVADDDTEGMAVIARQNFVVNLPLTL